MATEIRDLRAVPAVAVRARLPLAELDIAALMDRSIPLLAGRAIPGAGVAIAGAPYLRTWAWGEVADLEIGFPVAGVAQGLPALEAAESIHASVPGSTDLPGGRAMVLVHVGPYDGLPAAWAQLQAAVAAAGHRVRSAPWESYVADPSSTPAADVRTELVQPIED